ncbi:Uncharacterised protein [Escherichia coli]|nr:Uncharacterised protein [Escherichia coli]
MTNMSIFSYNSILLGKTVHNAIILNVRAIFHHDTTKIATQAGIRPNVNALCRE